MSSYDGRWTTLGTELKKKKKKTLKKQWKWFSAHNFSPFSSLRILVYAMQVDSEICVHGNEWCTLDR